MTLAARVAVDVGGTFTDICVFNERAHTLEIAKVPSSPDYIAGVLAAVREVGVDLHDVALFAHGTTVATNALITRQLPRTALVTTRGFRDVIEIRNGTREDLWDAYTDVPSPYIRRRDRFIVEERVDYSGKVVTPLDEEEARQLCRVIRRREITSIAVCFVNSFVNPAHERRMAEILAEEIPGVAVSISSDVLPEIFEHERFSTTTTNAVLSTLVGDYIKRLESNLVSLGYRGDLVLLHSGGGVMTSRLAVRFASRLAASGLAAGAIAARHVGEICGMPNVIGLDMGGTSADISLTYGGETQVTKNWSVDYGHPICFPSIEVITIGAGGGSLAWVDEGGALRNGPQSAGATPGPACYGAGGGEPTTTDASVVLGRLGDSLLGGSMRLDREAAEEAINARIASRLGMSTIEAAGAIIDVVNANMANAVRLVSIRRGYDPREFALVAFGGAGPLHGVALARELDIPLVIVPRNPGILSALGCLLIDIRHDLSTMFVTPVETCDPSDLEDAFSVLEEEARARLGAEGVSEEAMRLTRSLDMRYLGQWRSLNIPFDSNGGSNAHLDHAVREFHVLHERIHRYRRDDAPIEVYRVNVVAIGVIEKAHLGFLTTGHAPNRHASQHSRPVWFKRGEGPVETQVVARSTLSAGARMTGPVIIEQIDSTTMVPPGLVAEVDEWQNIRIHLSSKE